MLRALHINDFVIVEHAEIHFAEGFTVFSGETGAGKSILIDALSLTLGTRADAALLRAGAARVDISAIFDIPESAEPWLAEQALEGPELILRRVIDSQGRSKAFINGSPATLTQLRELGEHLVDIHGQHAHQSLLHTAKQRELLDTHGGQRALAQSVGEAWQCWQASEAALAEAQRDSTQRAEARALLDEQLAILDTLGLHAGEWEQLCAHQTRLAHAQSLLEGAGLALEALEGEQGSASQALSIALHALHPLIRHDPSLEALHQTLESAQIACAETISGLNGYLDRLEPDPAALAQAEQRMAAIFETARRFKIEPEALPAWHDELRARLAASDSERGLKALAHACQQAQQEYTRLAEALTQGRTSTAARLSQDVTAAMQTLSMAGGAFEARLHPGKPSAHGLETIEFLVAGHAGVAPRPLARVASGGELARISLALSVIASQAARVPTLIFDEVDTGIGGGVAEVVGRLLRQLGERHQVLCVTHLPQVAACAVHHLQVSKSTEADTTLSTIQGLDAPARVNEIARMLGGLTITETTRTHAREMLGLFAAH